MTRYFSDNEVNDMFNSVIVINDYLNAIKLELCKDFKAPWYILEKIEIVESLLNSIKYISQTANERTPEEI